MATSDPVEGLPSLKEACTFLSDYSSWLLGCGATCIRIEKNVERMAAAFRVEADLMIMPSNIQLSVSNAAHTDTCSMNRKVHRCGISFHINTRLSKLSWDVADGKLDFREAQARLEEIKFTPPTGKWEVLVLASLANMSFCRLFGGDFTSMTVVFCATLLGYRLKQVLLGYGLDVRAVFFCSAFAASVAAAGAQLFSWGGTPEIAVGTSVLYLIPGIPYINSVGDMLDGHYICAFSRFIDALLLTAALSLGLCGGMLLMGLEWL